MNKAKMTMKDAIKKGVLLVTHHHDPVCGLYRNRGWKNDDGTPWAPKAETKSELTESTMTIAAFYECHKSSFAPYVMLHGWQCYFGHILNEYWVKTSLYGICTVEAFNKAQAKRMCAGCGKVIKIIAATK